MAKKPTRFDWVRDAEEPLRESPERPSNKDRQRLSDEADSLVDPLLELPLSALGSVPLSELAREALEDVRRTRSNVARRRARLHFSALLRDLDMDAITEAIGHGSRKSTARDEQLESLVRWRARIVKDGDDALQAFLDQYPSADRQQMRNLAAQIRKDPKSRASKTLMGILKEAAGL